MKPYKKIGATLSIVLVLATLCALGAGALTYFLLDAEWLWLAIACAAVGGVALIICFWQMGTVASMNKLAAREAALADAEEEEESPAEEEAPMIEEEVLVEEEDPMAEEALAEEFSVEE
ncbi:MAG: hypothetical protein IKD43_00295 [Clostridia bacterium]|nr:hypothetical protein [Clostridia bacterium]